MGLPSNDRRGVVTSYADLTLSHTKTQSSLGLTWKTRTSGLAVYSSRLGSDSSEIQLEQRLYNLAGQLVSRSSSTNGGAVFDSSIDSNGYVINTTTSADGGTATSTLYRDGALKSVTGTAVSPVRYDYGVETDGTRWVRAIALDAGGADTAEWTKVWTDLAGRTFKTEIPTGAAVAYFNNLGQPYKSVDADNVTSLFTYDSRGRQMRSVLDMNRNGSIDDSGTDWIIQTDVTVTARADGRNVERGTQTVWTTDNATASTVLSTTDRAVDGLDTWVTVGGNTAQSHASYSGNGAWTETVTAGDGSTVIKSFSSGRQSSLVRKDSAGTVIDSTSYTYDTHGRLSLTQDGRGAATTYAYDSNDRVHTITGPAPTGGGTAPVTTIDYDNMGRQATVTDAANGTVTYTYTPTGAVSTVSGNRAYPISYTYTPQGRMASMTAATGTTTWVYEAATGRLWKKLDAANKGCIYTYTAAGRLLTKTNARGLVATYGYNNAGENSSVTYSDSTPSVTNTFNRLGLASAVISNGVTDALVFDAWGQIQSETLSGGPLSGLLVSHGYDALRRVSAVASVLGSTVLSSQGFGYDGASRLSAVAGGNETAIYGYDADASLVTSVTLKDGGTTRLTSQRTYDLAGRLTEIKSLNAQSQGVFDAVYAYNNLDQRTGVTREDGTQWAWGYNDRGEVTSGGKKFSDGTPQPFLQYGYSYDAIGNFLQRSAGVSPAHTSAYTPNTLNTLNTLNQYTTRTVPPYLSVTGEAAADANVVVQAKPATRKGSAFWREWNLDNTTGPVRENVRIAAAKPGAGANGTDLASLTTGKLYLPPATERFTYDDDGNLTSDSRWTYTWDAENRLLSIQENIATLPSGWVRQRLEFTYDPGSRRTRKTVKNWNGTAWQTTADTAFVYDGWNLIAELDITASPTLRGSYAWGLDVSGSLQGAGGVGGLLWATTLTPYPLSLFPSYDGNGNVIGYVDATSGLPVLKLDYDPFGGVVMAASMGTNAASSAAARAIPFRFSTKYTDRETGLSYYGYRYYRPDLGRWLNSDPLGELGGVNLYGMVGNNPVGSVDLLGAIDTAYWKRIFVGGAVGAMKGFQNIGNTEINAVKPIAVGLKEWVKHPGDQAERFKAGLGVLGDRWKNILAAIPEESFWKDLACRYHQDWNVIKSDPDKLSKFFADAAVQIELQLLLGKVTPAGRATGAAETAAKTAPVYEQLEFPFARGARIQTPGVTTAGETFVRVAATPERLNFSFNGAGGALPRTYAMPEATFNAIGRDPAVLKSLLDLPDYSAPVYYRYLQPPPGTLIQRGIVPGGEFGGVGGVQEVLFPKGF